MAGGLVRIGGDRMAFEGEQPDVNRLRGHFRSRSRLGLSQVNPVVAEAVRVLPQADAPDNTGKAALLRRILQEGLPAVPQDAEAMKKNGSRLTLPNVGTVQSISYLGQETKLDWPPPPGTQVGHHESSQPPRLLQRLSGCVSRRASCCAACTSAMTACWMPSVASEPGNVIARRTRLERWVS